MSAPARLPLPQGIETVRLRKIAPDFAYCDVRLPAVHLLNLNVKRLASGGFRISPPSAPDREGKPWPSYHLQPGTKEAVEAAICAVWEQSGGEDG
jgi:hypothetical protein